MSDADEYFMADRAPERAQKSKPNAKAQSNLDVTLESGLPASIDGEKTILGAILLDNNAWIETDASLQADDFSLDSHRRIFLRMSELMNSQRAVDIVTLANELARYKEVESVGGVAYLASLTEGLPRRPVIEEYIRIVKDKSLARSLMAISSITISRAADHSETALQVGMELSAKLEEIISSSLVHVPERAGDYLKREFGSADKMMETTDRLHGIDTGFSEWDEMTGGLQRGELIIVAARPSIGKTSWILKVLEHVCIESETPGVMFSLEMTKEHLLRKLVCSRARVPLQDHKKGTAEDWMKREFREVYAEIERSPLYIDDSRPLTAMQIRSQARAIRRSKHIEVVVIDYLGLLHHEFGGKLNQTQLIGLDCYILKTLAGELGVPVVVLCQLSRDVTKRTDKRPQLSDLRDSGNIEEHADVVSFLHREWYYDKSDDKLRDKGESILAKVRNGPTGVAKHIWNEHITRWSDIPDPNDQAEFDYWNSQQMIR